MFLAKMSSNYTVNEYIQSRVWKDKSNGKQESLVCFKFIVGLFMKVC